MRLACVTPTTPTIERSIPIGRLSGVIHGPYPNTNALYRLTKGPLGVRLRRSAVSQHPLLHGRRRRRRCTAIGEGGEFEEVHAVDAAACEGVGRIPRWDRRGLLPPAHRRYQDPAPARSHRSLPRHRSLRRHCGAYGGRTRAMEGTHPLRHAPHAQVRAPHGLQCPPPVRLQGCHHRPSLQPRKDRRWIRSRRHRSPRHSYPLRGESPHC